jgi:polar amino acid transport system substrate-binding protein
MTAQENKRKRIIAALAGAVLSLGPSLQAGAANAQTLDRIRAAGEIRLGYERDARPFSYEEEVGKAAGFSVALCTSIADRIKAELEMPSLSIVWTPVEGGGVQQLQSQTIDLYCGGEPVTLSARKEVSFSISIFPSGTGALVRADAPIALREVLSRGQPTDRPVWRGSPARTVLEQKTFSAVEGTTGETWLQERIQTFKLAATVAPVKSYDEGIQRVIDGETDVLFGDLPRLLDAASRSPTSGNLVVLQRHFTYEPIGLALPRDDEDFRLMVDRALSELYKSDGFRTLFTDWFGEPDEAAVTFFRQTALPD